MLWDLYQEWNAKINVISRKDIDNLYVHHVLHAMAIAKFINFKSGTKVLDLGCGGGFPGIPLAIFFPHVQFHLIDGTKKKITVVNEVANALGLENCKGEQIRAEESKGAKYDFVVTRAVATVDKLLPWSRRLLHHNHQNALPNGLITLKGNVDQEVKLLTPNEYYEVVPIHKWFDEPFFVDKFILYVQG
jgi:16S rRNA (guanine527-N7)-methyltransferase